MREFTADVISISKWHSLIDATGLGIKYPVESVVGVQYLCGSRREEK